MIKRLFPVLVLFAAIGWSSCEEKPVTIPELSVGERNVLVEELTGVQCPNCPDGAAKLTDLGKQLGDNLIVVSIHAANGYDEPYAESKEDYRIDKGKEIANFLGTTIGYPAAAINRRRLPNEPYLFLVPHTKWAKPIQDDIRLAPQVGIFLETNFDPVTRKLDIAVNIAPAADLAGEHRLTVLITQDSIQDYQKVGLNKVPDYMHRHVLREVLTQATGDVISEPLNTASVVKRNFTFTLPEKWEEKHCNVIAFVHHGTDPDKEILQAVEEHVIK